MGSSHFLVQLCFLLCSTVLLAAAYTRDGQREKIPRPFEFNLYENGAPLPQMGNKRQAPPDHSNNDTTTTVTKMTMTTTMMTETEIGGSCKDLCHLSGHDSKKSCQCNKKCLDYNDCCRDYSEECLSCDGRCNFTFDRNFPCQCNSKCVKFNNCCQDYSRVCTGGNITIEPDRPQNQQQQQRPPTELRPDNHNRAPVTDAELATFSEAIFELEGPNNVKSLIRVNAQNRTSFGAVVDRSSLPLLTVNQAAYQKPTIAKLLALHNNYVPGVSAPEVLTPQESAEETLFLDAVLATPLMKKAEKFLVDKGFVVTQRRINGKIRVNNRAFREALYQIWFNFYSRDSGALGSSGFEHIFLGETKAGQVSGFHNWVFFSTEEAKNNLNYYGHTRVLGLGPKAAIIKHNFKWIENHKPISTMFIGTSPEFELALYTVCFYARPGAKCPVTLQGKNFNIQTHFLTRNGKRYVASAYPDI